MHHPYRLYGVATRRDVIYLLHPDTTSNTPDAKQWWRVQYDNESGTANILRSRIDQQQVLERATTEAASVLLIYANDAATSASPLPLSKPLADFVKKDKLAFLEELQKNHDLGAGAGWDDFGDEARGDWDRVVDPNPPGYNHDWANIDAQHHDEKIQSDALSSATLTPNTDVGSESGVREMVEVNGGAAGGISNGRVDGGPSSLAGLRSDPMDVDPQGQSHSTDAQMVDVPEVPSGSPRAQHIEVVEKKGG